MSVFLEGIICEGEGGNLEWNGTWQFVRDRSAKVKFRYEMKSTSIPNDLIDYVSFRNSASGAGGNVLSAIKNRRNKKKHGTLQSTSVVTSAVLDISNETNTENVEVIEVEGEEETLQEVVPEDDTKEGENIESLDATGEASNVDSANSVDSGVTTIHPIHPLFGYWDGAFDVRHAVNPDVPVPESLFFYSHSGFAKSADKRQEEVDDVLDNSDVFAEHHHALPPEQLFSYSVLKILKDEFNYYLPDKIKAKLVKIDPTAVLVKTPVEPAAGTEPSLSSASTNVDGIASAASIANTESIASAEDAVVSEISPTTDTEPVVKIEEDKTLIANAYGYVDYALARESFPPNISILIGFGKNMFGRFALIGAYNETTKHFVCEKRYMVGKYSGINRFRLPTLASAHATGNRDEVDENGKKRKRVSINRSRYVDLFDSEAAEQPAGYGYTPRKSKDPMSGTKEKDIFKQQKQADLRNFYEHYLPDEEEWHTQSDKRKSGGSRDHSGGSYKSASVDIETGDIYEGGWVDGMRHGKGICVYSPATHSQASGDHPPPTSYKPDTYYMYEGDWYRNKEHGKGVYMTGDRQIIYEGEFLDGMKHGTGEYYFPNGDMYVGDFKEGVRSGRGKYVYAHGIGHYDGDWREDKRHGKGIFTWLSPEDVEIDGSMFSSTYNGDWEHNVRHGRGVLLLTNGFYYDGHWDKGVMDGKGECIYPLPEEPPAGISSSSGMNPPTPTNRSQTASPGLSRSLTASPGLAKLNANHKSQSQSQSQQPLQQIYQGSFKAGLRDGRGTIIFAEGAEYEGRFKDDRLDGYAGTLKITQPVPGSASQEVMIPIQLQADIKRIQLKAGFGEHAH